MDIPLPAGYLAAAPFDRERHRRLGIPRDVGKFARALNVIYITTAEFPRACHDYPIAFARDGSGNVVPLIVTGLDDGTNLFVDEVGVWAADAYCPAYVRRYPFFTATIAQGGEEQALICVDEETLSKDAPALISASGEPTDRWRELELLITEMDTEQRKTNVFSARLGELDLLEPFEADFHPRGKPPVRVAGLLRVDEQRLRRLNESELASLMREGHLGRIYAHLLSLENFNRLLDRYVA